MKPYLIKVGNVIVNLSLVHEVHFAPGQVAVFYPFPDLGNGDSPMYNVFEGAEADALQLFLEEEAIDVVALAEVKEEEALPEPEPLQFRSSAQAIPATFTVTCCGQDRDLFTTPRCPACGSRPAIVPGSSSA